MNHLAPVIAEAAAPPHHLELEQALLGAVMVRAEHLDGLLDIPPEAFYDEQHQAIWGSVIGHRKGGLTPHPLMVGQSLQGVVPAPYVNSLAIDCPDTSARAVGRYVEGLKRYYGLRQLKELGQSIDHTAGEARPDESVTDLASLAIERLSELQARDTLQGPTVASLGLEAILERAQDKTKAPVLEVTSGLEAMDAITGNFRAGELWIFGGRPGMGKTIVGANIARAAAQAGHGALYFSLEMKKAALQQRLLCDLVWQQGKELWTRSLRTGGIPRELMQPLLNASHELEQLPLYIDDIRGQSLASVTSKARQVKRELRSRGLDLSIIVIDYMTLLTPADRYRGNKVQEVTELSRGLKILAGELEIPVIALAQLNRQTESRDNKDNRPKLSDLRESGSIEQDADGVVLLFREEYYVQLKRPPLRGGEAEAIWKAQYAEVRDRLELIVAKNREGETGTIEARVIARCSAVRDA